MLVVRNAVVGPFAANCYLAICTRTGDAVLVDPGGDSSRVLDLRQPEGYRIERIFCTHGHIDHTAGASEARAQTGASLQIHGEDEGWLRSLARQAEMFGLEPAEAPPIDHRHADGEAFWVGACEGKVVHTPGHTPGSCCLYFPTAKILFTGDTLFSGSIGRTDLPGGDLETLVRSIREKLFTLGDDVRVYPGHGPVTSIGDERRANPFVGDAPRHGRFL